MDLIKEGQTKDGVHCKIIFDGGQIITIFEGDLNTVLRTLWIKGIYGNRYGYGDIKWNDGIGKELVKDIGLNKDYSLDYTKFMNTVANGQVSIRINDLGGGRGQFILKTSKHRTREDAEKSSIFEAVFGKK